jgi:hypothetical protein
MEETAFPSKENPFPPNKKSEKSWFLGKKKSHAYYGGMALSSISVVYWCPMSASYDPIP